MRIAVSASLCSVPLAVALFFAPPARPVYAQTAPASINQAVTNSVVSWATSHGFNTADPRIGETLSAMGARATAVAASAAAALGVAASSISWGAVAAYAGIGAVLGAVPTSLGANDGVQWTFNPDGTIVVTTAAGSASSIPKNPASVPCPTGNSLVYTGYSCQYGSDKLHPTSCWEDEQHPQASVSAGASQFPYTYVAPLSTSKITAYLDQIYAACPAVAGEVVSGPPPTPPSAPMSPVSAGSQVPAGNDGDTLNPTIVAGLANTLWSQAAQGEGYAGLPYPVDAPVLPADVSGIESGMGASAPTVGGFVGAPASGSSGSPYSLPGQATSTGAGTSTPASVPSATTPGSGAQVNLGPDPGIGSPGLEATPTAQAILQPLLSMLPSLRSFAVPAHSASCPQPTFTVFDQSFTISQHCTLFEQYRSTIYGASLLAFGVAALLIVLTA
jgi:hypothetical protein